MKALILTCFESNEERAKLVLKSLKIRGYDTKVFTSDFSHIKKTKRENVPEEFEAICTVEYSKNLSLKRMYSHYEFSKRSFVEAEKYNPDLIWVMAPANSLILAAEKYKRNHPKVKVIVDIIDMWPESFPVSKLKNTPPFLMWRNIRSRHIAFADKLVSECDLYRNILGKEYGKKIKTIHWASAKQAQIYTAKVLEDRLSLCYLGSINNIIDTDRICQLIKNSGIETTVHIIGLGEHKEEMVSKLSQVCEVTDHGAIYDDEKKAEIMSLCHGGLNIYKESLYIGLTIKSIDYFRFGLPVVNNIKGDTWKMVEENKAGINIAENTKINFEELKEMRKNSDGIYGVFNRFFSEQTFIRGCLEVIDEVVG